MRRNLLILAFAASVILAGRASAHHSFAATYIVDKEIKIDGKLVEFMYRNPHSFVKVEGPDDAGQMQTWTIEWGGGAQLSRDGVSRDTLKAGDRVIVSGNPGRDASEHRLRLHSIVRPSDGWKWVGTIQEAGLVSFAGGVNWPGSTARKTPDTESHHFDLRSRYAPSHVFSSSPLISTVCRLLSAMTDALKDQLCFLPKSIECGWASFRNGRVQLPVCAGRGASRC